MNITLLDWLQAGLRTLSQISMAGIAITAFSLFLYSLAFNLRNRVARSFALIMICVVITFTAESLASANSDLAQSRFWLITQWVGIILLPPVYLQFSNALLETTGKVSKGKRRASILFAYLLSFIFLLFIPLGWFVGQLLVDNVPIAHLQPVFATYVFALYYLAAMAASWINFSRSFNRTTTSTSKRRMRYMITGALAPAIGSFPFLLFGSGIVSIHGLVFWSLTGMSNALVLILVVVMAYAVAFYGTPWPDRVVKSRLFKWIMRGPFTASVTLGVVTIVRRMGALFGEDYSAIVPILMVGTILLLEYLITLFAPLGERFLFWGKDSGELQVLRQMEDRLLTKNDLKQFLEIIISAVCDRMQAQGGYIAAFSADGIDRLVMVGKAPLQQLELRQWDRLVLEKGESEPYFHWGDDLLFPLEEQVNGRQLVGLMGVIEVGNRSWSLKNWKPLPSWQKEQPLPCGIAGCKKIFLPIFKSISRY